MGHKFFNIVTKIILPLVYTNILVGGILVFVDVLKELPITLLLRPFNFETLATYVYQYASDETKLKIVKSLSEELKMPSIVRAVKREVKANEKYNRGMANA